MLKTLKKHVNYLLRCLTLDERRLEARKVCNLGCVRQKSKDWKPISSIPSDPGKYFFANILAPILSDVKAKVKKILLLFLDISHRAKITISNYFLLSLKYNIHCLETFF